MSPPDPVVVGGPYFEDLRRGDVFDSAPGLTLTDGHAAVHQALLGDRLPLALDHELSRRVTGAPRPIAHPALVWDVAIGQSTQVTRRVVANLFYRGLSFRRAPLLGDTVHTRTEVVALKQNSARPDRDPTGLVALRITTTDQKDRTVLDFWRCAMLPLRDRTVLTGEHDELSGIGPPAGTATDPGESVADWRLAELRREGTGVPEVRPGALFEVAGGDVVSGAPELARLTLNVAQTHHDDAAGPGRLVYGGHTIGLALTQVVRALPELVTVLAWDGCDHLGPVREGDTLTSRVEVTGLEPRADGRLVRLRSLVRARAEPGSPPRPVLDWRFVALLP